jgi:hypothetical protein
MAVGVRGSVVGWGTMLQAGKSRVRVPMKSLNFSMDLILPAALMALRSTQNFTARYRDSFIFYLISINTLKMCQSRYGSIKIGVSTPIISWSILWILRSFRTYALSRNIAWTIRSGKWARYVPSAWEVRDVLVYKISVREPQGKRLRGVGLDGRILWKRVLCK